MIYQKFLMVAVVALAATGIQATQPPQQSPDFFIAKLRYNCAWARGLLQGFEEGYFKNVNYQISPKCLSADW